MEEYLRKDRPELARNEIDTQEELEQSISCGSTTRLDGTIDRRAGIRSRTARKRFNCLGYKWKEVQKEVFLNGHKREDVIEYGEKFLDEIKALSYYFIEFDKDRSILPKEYLKNCAVEGLDQRPIIMIIYNKNTFFANYSF